MDRKHMQPKRGLDKTGRHEKNFQNPSAERIESWLKKLPPSLLDEEGQRSIPEITSTVATATKSDFSDIDPFFSHRKTDNIEIKSKPEITSTLATGRKSDFSDMDQFFSNRKTGNIEIKSKPGTEKKTGENVEERHHKKREGTEEKKKGKNSKVKRPKDERVKKNETEEAKLRDTVEEWIDVEEIKAKSPPKNKVDRVTLHRRLKEYKKTQATLFSASRGPRMAQNKWEFGNQKPKESVALDPNALGWRKSWDIFIPDYHARKEGKEAENLRNENMNQSQNANATQIPIHVESEVDPDIVTEPTIKNHKDHLKDDIFGYRSLLNEQTRIIYRPYSTSGTNESESESGESGGPDMSWVRRLSASDKKSKQKSIWRHRDSLGPKGERSPLYIIWIYLILGARMPFIFVQNPDPSIRAVSCKFDRHRRYYYAFLVTSVLLFLLTVITLISFFAIFFEDENQDKPHIQIEKLLLDKNFVAGIVFMTTLIMATISSLHVLKNGEAMAEYITHWEESLDELNFNATTGIRLLTTIFIIWTTGQAVGEALLFYNKRLELNPYIEGVHLMILLVFRNFYGEILTSEYRDYCGALVIGLNNYSLYCARSFILLVMVFSVGMTNIANEWNFRLRLILNYVSSRQHEVSIRDLLRNLNYRKVFDEHQRIAKLVKDTSRVFGTLLLAFYLTQGIDLGGQLIEIAVFVVGTEEDKFVNLTAQTVNYRYEKDIYNRLDVAIRLSQTIAVVVIVSVYLAATGEAMMDALYLITRHTHMKVVSTHQRDFMMSLVMSFNPKQPYLLGSGGILHVDKPFMYSYFAVAVFFLSVMMQTRIPRLLSVPIVFECSLGSGTLCSGVQQVRPNVPGAIYNMSLKVFPIFLKSPNFPCAGGAGIPGSQLFKCAGVEVDRFRVYDKDGFDKSDRLNNSFDCIYNPYPASNGPYYDCFGNHLTVVDSCGMLNFGVGSTLPGLSVDEIRLPYMPFVRRPVMCNNLNKKFYTPSNEIGGDFLKFVCGYPHWLARVICFDSSKPEPPRNLTLVEFQLAIRNEIFNDSNQRLDCDMVRVSDFLNADGTFVPLAPLAPVGTTTRRTLIIRPLPMRAPPARQYFSIFHPELLGEHTKTAFITVCRAGKGCFCSPIPLVHDDCGGLALHFVETTNFTAPGTIFRCFKNDTTCTAARCEEWRTWFDANRPVF